MKFASVKDRSYFNRHMCILWHSTAFKIIKAHAALLRRELQNCCAAFDASYVFIVAVEYGVKKSILISLQFN